MVYGARPSAGHYTNSRYARDQSSATHLHLKFFFCIVRSACALQKTSSFVLFTNKTSFLGGFMVLFFLQKKADGRTHERTNYPGN